MKTTDTPSTTTLLRALGRSGSRAVIDAYCARGADALRELLEALLEPRPLEEGAEHVNGRAMFEEEEECVSRLAGAHPEVFVEVVRERPELLDHFSVLSAVGRVPGPDTTEWLLRTLKHSRGSIRWLALSALLQRGEERVAPKLRTLLKDRDGLVAFEAIDGLRRWGTPGDVPALFDQVTIGSIGAREAALDAIETICTRSGEPLPAQHPGPRLETLVARAPELEIPVIVSSWVTEGMPLARWEGGVLSAPFEGVVSAIEQVDGEVRITLRRQPPAQR